jgi:long-chain fatty acid transport protein
MSMGGATAQPIDISGALKWNPAISVFEGRTISLSAGLFMANPNFFNCSNSQWSNER